MLVWKERLYFRPSIEREWLRGKNKAPKVVLHAASVGELEGLFPVVEKLFSMDFRGTIFLSVGTYSGYEKAKVFSRGFDHLCVIPAPLDLPKAVNRFLELTRPDLFLTFEAEFWPVLFYALRKRKIPTLLVNGRVSKRSFRGYRLFNFIFRPIFQNFRLLGMVSERDLRRAIYLGASPEKTFVTGNSKYDNLIKRKERANPTFWKTLLKLHDSFPVCVFGSIRGIEYPWSVDAIKELFKIFPKSFAIVAPRHLSGVGRLERMFYEVGISFQRLSYIRDRKEEISSRVVIVDFLGSLFELYALGDIVFCGGTVAPIGGHNIVEPIVWGKKVFYGPFIDKVYEEHLLLRAFDASFYMEDPKSFVALVCKLIEEGKAISICEKKQKMILEKLMGASEVYTRWIMESL